MKQKTIYVNVTENNGIYKASVEFENLKIEILYDELSTMILQFSNKLLNIINSNKSKKMSEKAFKNKYRLWYIFS